MLADVEIDHRTTRGEVSVAAVSRLAAQALPVDRVARQVGVKHLDRHRATGAQVGGPVDGAHAPAADLVAHEVAVGDDRAGRSLHTGILRAGIVPGCGVRSRAMAQAFGVAAVAAEGALSCRAALRL